MARITVPEADAVLDESFPVLDQGFVRLIDYFGGDARVVQAARVSYGAGTKTVREDQGLINYLMRNAHTSPFEMIDMVFHIKLPLFVFAQMVRHRTACLAGDTQLYFDLPGADRRGRRQRHNVQIAEFYRLWHEGTSHGIAKKKATFVERVEPEKTYTVRELANLVERSPENLRSYIAKGLLEATRVGVAGPNGAVPDLRVTGQAWHRWANTEHQAKVPMKARLQNMSLRMCDESTGEIRATQVRDIWQTGVKPVFRVTLENGYAIKMTKDHRCLTDAGWATLEAATGLAVREDGGVTWRADGPSLAVNGVPCHTDRAWLQSRRERGDGVVAIAEEAGVSYHTIRKWLKVHGLSFSTSERSRLSGFAQRGQKRPPVRPRVISAETLERMRLASSGERSHFWKGGVSTERETIGRWTTGQAPKVHHANGYACVLCGSGSKLHAHHVDPVWHAPDRARLVENLTTLCTPCHTSIHARNLELDLLAWRDQGAALGTFWESHSEFRPRPATKRLPRAQKLIRSYSRIAKIEYVGEEMTYDLEVAGPYHNFVANGFIVHNSLNSMSARYSVMTDEFYLPTGEQVRGQSATNKQVSEGGVADATASHAAESFRAQAEAAYAIYEKMIADGVGREQARMVLPQNLYTQIYWKCDLHNLFHFLRLRLDWHAQQEIRAYAVVMADLAKKVAPLCYQAFEEHVLNAQRFGATELDALRRMLAGQPHGLEGRAATEFEAKLALTPAAH